MKKILIILSASLAIAFIPLMIVSAQETKTEKKIKIIVDDGTGKKVIVDTLISEDPDIETLKLDDGKLTIISSPDDKHDHGSTKNVTVTVTSDGEDGKKTKEVKEIRIISTDSVNVEDAKDGKKVYVYTINSDRQNNGSDDNVAVRTTIKDVKESTTDKTRYVVAKDGMVVTVEGEDEVKTKELIKIIEDHLGVKSENTEKQLKTETKKISKK